MQVDHEAGAAPGGGLTVQALVHGLGAAVSLALLAGVAVWGWKLAVRDVSGVPVVRALEGPMRVAPDQPGGMQAAYQGLAVNAVAAGDPAVQAERIVLAPAPPSLAELQAAAGSAPGGADGAVEDDRAEVAAVAWSRGEGAEAAIPPSVPGVVRSPVPRPRPGVDLVAETAARAVLQALAPGATLEIDPETLSSGTRLVQLCAYDDRATAQAEWEALALRFAAHMEGKARVIQAAEAGGRTFYRLRAHGFSDEAEARRFCAVLLPEGVNCISVLIR